MPKDCRELQSLLDGSNIKLRSFPVLRLIEHKDARGWSKVSKVLQGPSNPPPWLVLTSPRAPQFLCEQARDMQLESLLTLKTAAIGPATSKAAEAAGFKTQVVGPGSGTDLARELEKLWPPNTTAILAAGVHARPEVPTVLKAAGHRVLKLKVYEMRATPVRELPPVGPADGIVLTSPRAAELYLEAVGGLPLPLVHWALGTTTQNAANWLGIKDCRIPESPSMGDLAAALTERHATGSS